MKKALCIAMAAALMSGAVSCGEVTESYEEQNDGAAAGEEKTSVTDEGTGTDVDDENTAAADEESGAADGEVKTEELTEEYTAAANNEASADTMSVYRAALEQIYYSGDVPLWQNITDDNWDISENDFAVYDVDLDGRSELIFLRGSAPMAGMYAMIYDVDENGELRVELETSPFMHFFSNGKITVDISHNQGVAGGFWPYTLLGYDAASDSYDEIAYVDAWDGSIFPENYDGEPFPSDVDTSGSGFVYYIYAPEAAYDRENMPEPIDRSEFDEWYNEQLGDAQEVFPEFLKLTEENIALLTEN